MGKKQNGSDRATLHNSRQSATEDVHARAPLSVHSARPVKGQQQTVLNFKLFEL